MPLTARACQLTVRVQLTQPAPAPVTRVRISGICLFFSCRDRDMWRSKSQFWAGMTHLWSVLGWSYRFNVSYGQKHEQVRFRPFFLVHSRAFA